MGVVVFDKIEFYSGLLGVRIIYYPGTGQLVTPPDFVIENPERIVSVCKKAAKAAKEVERLVRW